jgi:hypothetical protein
MKLILAVFSIIIFFLQTSDAQKMITIKNGCSYNGEVKNKQVFVRECKNQKILNIINSILSTISIQKNFDIYEADIENALATKFDNQRLIIVDPEFLDIIEEITGDKYASYLIIAHEIGHHLNAHIDKPSSLSPFWDELESDHFAGGTLQKLGILPVTIKNVTNLIAPQMSTSKTHPEWQARMKAAINGYCQSAFVETKKNIITGNKSNYYKIVDEEAKLEQVLNYNIYNKAHWLKNIRYKVSNKVIYKEYETSLYNGRDQSAYKMEKYNININSITKIFLRWHDPGEVEIETLVGSKIETLQNANLVPGLKPFHYFDNEDTITDDLNLMVKITTSIAKIQALSELK